jgi:FKBP-type peptidyl-prolyl cis-trans isomerase
MLAGMAQTEGVKTLDTGVLVHVIDPSTVNSGKRATRSSTVKIMYHGTLADGTVFDSTMVKGDAVTFPLAAVIPGWRDAVLEMEEGQTAMVGIPPEQAYGVEGSPDGRVPGGSTLFFKIQLLEILSASIEGRSQLLGADGNSLQRGTGGGGGLLGADGKPLVG